MLMLHFKFLYGLCLFTLMFVGCSSSSAPLQKADRYVITSPEDRVSSKWAEYLSRQLENRASEVDIIELHKGVPKLKLPQGTLEIRIDFKSDLDHAYCIEKKVGLAKVKIRDERTALWITYQIIEKLSTIDSRIDARDLDPATVSFDPGCFDFDFLYRDPHFQPNLDLDLAAIAGNNNVEVDWGLWGHNLSKLLTRNVDDSFFAEIDGKVMRDQIAFSSDKLFTLISEYIIDDFGDGRDLSHNFMIAPRDNDLVDLSSRALELGNIPGNATPEVSYFVNKLAEKFPHHQFFMVGYRTTKTPPTYKLRPNIGVSLSTIALQRGVAIDEKHKETKVFLNQVEGWKLKTDNIFLWDYISNFDDYLTPLPVLYGLQKQLKFYKSRKIRGIFLNGSGYDYTSFQGVKTYVIGELLKDVNADIEHLVNEYFKKKYPVSGEIHSQYYLKLEKSFANKNIPYDMYGGFSDIRKTYLNETDFLQYYKNVLQILPKLNREEQENLERLVVALSFTRLQIAYYNGFGTNGFAERNGTDISFKPEVTTWLNYLANYSKYKGIDRYRESGGSLESYIAWWKELLLQKKGSNLYSLPIELISNPDEGYEDSAVLTDGLQGFPLDYHLGWLLSSADLTHLRIPIRHVQPSNNLKVRFLIDTVHKIEPPEEVEISLDGNILKTYKGTDLLIAGNTALLNMPIKLLGKESLEIKILKRQSKGKSIAIDEVILN